MKIYQVAITLALGTYFASAVSAQDQKCQTSSLLIFSLDASQVQKLTRDDSLPLEFLNPNQYHLYANFVKAAHGYTGTRVSITGMSDKQIVALPVHVNFILAASIRVESGIEDTQWQPVYKYSHPTPVQPQPSRDGPNFNRAASSQSAASLATNRLLFRSVKPLVLAGYPAGLPIPEAAFIRQVRVPFSALSPAQRKFVRSVILNDGFELRQPFDWNKATVSFARKLNFRGEYARDQPPLYANTDEFEQEIW